MAAPLSSRQNSPASQLLQKNIAICPSPCGSGLARDGVATVFKAELAGKPAPTEKHRNLPPPPVGAGLPAMAAPLSSRQNSPASQRLQKNTAICPSPCGSGLARDGVAAVFKAKLAGKPAPTEKHRNLPLPLWERACPRWQRRWLQGRARRQASSYRKTPQSPASPLWERACPRWRRCCLQGKARRQASAYRKASQSPPPPVGAGLPAMAAPLAPSKPRRLNRPPQPHFRIA